MMVLFGLLAHASPPDEPTQRIHPAWVAEDGSERPRETMWLDVASHAVLSVEAPEVGLLFDSGLVEVECTARFGHLTFSWVETRTVAPGARMSLEISPPREAFLHELAERYVTDLEVYVHFGRMKRSPGPAYIIWRDGVASVHPMETLQALAPHGMIGGPDIGMRIQGDTRVLPPLSNPNRRIQHVLSAEEAP